MQKNLSIVIPTYNEEGNIIPLLQRIDDTLTHAQIPYEVIIVDDHSIDRTKEIVVNLAKIFPITLLLKHGKRGKAQSIIEGTLQARSDYICMIDGDLQYPTEEIPSMLAKIEKGADIVVADRQKNNVNMIRKLVSKINRFLFVQILHGLNTDAQAGLKVFKKEIMERIQVPQTPWAFDLEFLLNAKNAGYKIKNHKITFSQRENGKSKINVFNAAFQIGLNSLKIKFAKSAIIPFHKTTIHEKGKGFHHKGKEFVHHSELHHSQTAFYRLSSLQIFGLLFFISCFVLGLFINWHTTLLLFVALLTVLYFVDLLFNLFLIYRSFSKAPEIQITEEELQRVNEDDWPTYTVLCPLYEEWQVVPQFVKSMSKLDYPKDKLQVMLLLEENDTETIKKIQEYNLPAYFHVVVVPHSLPKTKPKACNYGLLYAEGDYTVIYDAEDAPDPLQLKKAVLAFVRAGRKTICIQAKLNFYNPNQNVLTRMFTAEYSLWFDLLLTGLQSINAPIPLGGTSNHFRTKDLFRLKGWDSFNVTEDADLGMRLVKQGYKTAIVDSITLEEANSNFMNWFGQRSRWIKGYMQTYLVHMRSVSDFATNKKSHMITFQLIIGGKTLSMFINPFMWMITISYFVFREQFGPFIESFFPAPILYMAVFSLLFGNFLYLYYYMIACAKHEQEDLIPYIFLVPFYWLAMSVASWFAFYKLITAPHHWSKTKHGLHLKEEKKGEKTNIFSKQFTPNFALEASSL